MDVKERNTLDNLNNKYKELLNQRQLQEEYLKYKNIADNDIWYVDIIKDYNKICKDYNENIKEEQEILFNKKELEKRIDNLLLRMKTISSLEYNNTSESKSIELNLSNLDNEKFLLNKHPLLNRRKIKKIDNDIKKYKDKYKQDEKKYDDKNKDELVKLSLELEVLKSTLNDRKYDLDVLYSDRKRLENILNDIKNEIKEKYDCDSIEDVELVINYAKEFIKKNKINYDYSIDLKIDELREKIYESELENNSKKI